MNTPEKTAEFLARLDAAIGCQQCGGPLTESVSDIYCSERCSMIYSGSRASDLAYQYWDEDEHGWTAEALADLEPVSWIAPPVWRLPRSTGDLEADGFALAHAIDTSTTDAHMAACELRRQSLAERQRQMWAREWRLPRATGNFWKDNTACNLASSTATTPAQVAACELRRIEIQNYKPRPYARTELTLGRSAHWEFDHHASPLVHTRISRPLALSHDPASPTYVYGPYGHGPRPIDSSFDFDGYRISPPPALVTPALRTGDTVSITRNGETLRYEVTDIDGTRMTCTRVPEDDQPPTIQGAEITQAIIDETTPASPQTRALEARRNRNTGPATRPGPIRGNVPGARR